jgi:menaquinone-dependent protoporphyrinogen oxidase
MGQTLVFIWICTEVHRYTKIFITGKVSKCPDQASLKLALFINLTYKHKIMRTAIIYSTSHGTTQKVAEEIKSLLGDEKAQLFNLKKDKNFDITEYEQVILGGSIHAGRIQRRIKDFSEKHTQELLERKLGLFLCCMFEEKAEEQFNNAYPEILRNHAGSNKVLGGELLFEKMNFFEKAMVKKIAGVHESVSKIDKKKIIEFVNELNQ